MPLTTRHHSHRNHWSCRRFTVRGMMFLMGLACWFAGTAAAALDAPWIWSPEQPAQNVPTGSCYFRKAVAVANPTLAEIEIAADDHYELYVNGRRAAGRVSERESAVHDITRLLTRGRNLIAVKATNLSGSTAGLQAEIRVKTGNNEWTKVPTDATWRTNLRPLPLWNTTIYNDSRWVAAQVIGSSSTAPRVARTTTDTDEPAEQSPPDAAMSETSGATASIASETLESDPQGLGVSLPAEFRFEQLVDDEATGSLNALTFNEFGHLIAAQTEGPLLLVYDSDDDEIPETVRVYCDQVRDCQGILALNGEVFVTGDGPDGWALYRLTDEDRNGSLEKVRALVKFRYVGADHGPHGIALGPDGLIYVTAGNHTQLAEPAATESPYRQPYEGDIVHPRYEDPHGHERGIGAPGGFVFRTDIEGTMVEMVAGGLRDAYDLAFNRQGDLFTHDTHMPSDVGLPWHRPSRICHVTPGAEFGWRAGWAKWPEYYVDSVPSVLSTGRGLPTGVVFYEHFAFPSRFHSTLFLADWMGRILVANIRPEGSTYSAETRVFLDADGLHVSDMAVGPDGSLYLTTGRHGARGGIYRVSWTGQIPPAVADLGTGITTAIRQPQPLSAYSRQNVATVMTEIDEVWGKQLAGVSRSKSNPWYYRVRALDTMQLFGPPPSEELLLRLSQDEDDEVRARVAQLLGLLATDQATTRLVELLEDDHPRVRRNACESLLRTGATVPWDTIRPLLVSTDRFEATAARRLLERQPSSAWREAVLTTDDHRLFIQGSVALLTADGDRENAHGILDRFSQLLTDYITDSDFVDMLRVAQIALAKGAFSPDELPKLRDQLAEEFPAADPIMNRELIRLLAHLKVSDPLPRYLAYLNSEASDSDKLLVALHLQHFTEGWQPGQRVGVIEFLERAIRQAPTATAAAYIGQVERDFAKDLSSDEGGMVLARGAEWPGAALGVLYKLKGEIPDEVVTALIKLDQSLVDDERPTAAQLRTGLVAVFARNEGTTAQGYLRRLWQDEPQRRSIIAMGLAQHPGNENLPYLVDSLPVLDANGAEEVCRQLATVDWTPDSPEPIRQLIILAQSTGARSGHAVLKLLRRWTGAQPADENASWDQQVTAWQQWFAEQYPDQPPAERAVEEVAREQDSTDRAAR